MNLDQVNELEVAIDMMRRKGAVRIKYGIVEIELGPLALEPRQPTEKELKAATETAEIHPADLVANPPEIKWVDEET